MNNFILTHKTQGKNYKRADESICCRYLYTSVYRRYVEFTFHLSTTVSILFVEHGSVITKSSGVVPCGMCTSMCFTIQLCDWKGVTEEEIEYDSRS